MKKMLPWLVSLLLAIALIVIVGIYSWSMLFGDSGEKDPAKEAQQSVENVQAKPMTADEVLEVTSELTDIKTNIGDNSHVVILSFSFQLDKESTKIEFDKIKDIQVRPIVNRALWALTPADLEGVQGRDKLCADLINAINPILAKGKLTKVEITNFLISPI